MIAQHTPGPWEDIDGNSSGRAVIALGQPKVRLRVAACGGPNRDGNARLIAAAPDGLEFAQAWDAYLEARYSGPGSQVLHPEAARIWKMCRAFIAKATERRDGNADGA